VGDLTVARSGHVYFTLNDQAADASLRAVMWRSRYALRPFDLEGGRKIRATGKLTIYPPRGAFQMDVAGFLDAGEGILARRFREVVARLEAEGLTDPARRRPLPFLPRCVGLVTSPDGAAIRDVLRVLERRFPVTVLLAPSPVQGEEAPARLRAALARIDAVPAVEVIILGRGGGSAEDLAAFNDEALARAVAGTRVPVISAVGHEVDVSVTDLVADRRAATPSEAAELAVPSREDVEKRLSGLARRLASLARGRIRLARNVLLRAEARVPRPDRMIMDRRQRLDEVRSRIGRAGPEARIVEGRHRLERGAERVASLARSRLASARASLEARSAALEALSPLAVLGRGYAVVRRAGDGAVVRRADEVATGEELDVRLHEGSLACEVTGRRDGS
jgi:exodeoxyribonuclease VII large subunit